MRASDHLFFVAEFQDDSPMVRTAPPEDLDYKQVGGYIREALQPL